LGSGIIGNAYFCSKPFSTSMKHFSLLLLIAFVGCTPRKGSVDLLLYNARVYTVDEDFSTVSAFAVNNGKIVAVGDSEQLRANFDAGQLLDAGGKAVIPGLIDAHCHFYALGLKQQQLDLTGSRSFQEVLDRVGEFRHRKEMDFIFGKGWDQNDWELKEFPDKAELDSLYPDIPVVLERIDGHAYLVNQKVLDLAGIGTNTLAEGGEIIKINGEPSGILIDGPMELVNAIIPKPTMATRIQAISDAEKICLGYGLTTVNDAGLDPETISLIDSLQQAGRVNIRVYAMVSSRPENLRYFLEKGPLKTDRLNVRSFKVYADGALGSRGAVLKAPYSDQPGHFGAMVTPVERIYSLAERIAESGFQMNTHAIGDSANAVVLRAYRKVLDTRPDRRWKIEHSQVVSPEDAALFDKGIIPSVQPTHATSDMYWAGERLGQARVGHAYAYKTLLESAGRIALGTDFPVEEVSPFLTFYAAVARQDIKGYPDGGYRSEEALSREEALRGMTIWAAWSNFEENEKGSIEEGKWADFVILSNDLMQVPVYDIPGLVAEQVYIGGEKVK
jgi:hypothetical protein